MAAHSPICYVRSVESGAPFLCLAESNRARRHSGRSEFCVSGPRRQRDSRVPRKRHRNRASISAIRDVRSSSCLTQSSSPPENPGSQQGVWSRTGRRTRRRLLDGRIVGDVDFESVKSALAGHTRARWRWFRGCDHAPGEHPSVRGTCGERPLLRPAAPFWDVSAI